MSEPTVRYSPGPSRQPWWRRLLLLRRRRRWHTYSAQIGPDGTHVWVDGEPTAPGTPLPWDDPSHDVMADVRQEIRRIRSDETRRAALGEQPPSASSDEG